MSDTAIRLTGLTKRFVLSGNGGASLKTALLWWKRRKVQERTVLNGIDLEIRKGECLAIIGRNGAGKSTLLSLLARIYKPTSGTIEVNGRVAPLLELGAGFHPDLSGVENIGFNAVILGLTRAQVAERMQAIMDFSELGEYLHAPVRTYSSGMQARLGFSVAMHVDADILIVDEVLAVGDKDFERKCYAKIDEFRRAGGTILLVSHQIDSVLRFADRAAWLHEGRIDHLGDPADVVEAYLADGLPGA